MRRSHVEMRSNRTIAMHIDKGSKDAGAPSRKEPLAIRKGTPPINAMVEKLALLKQQMER